MFNFFKAPKLPKEFDVRYSLPGFETGEKAETRRSALIEVLEKGPPDAQELAKILRACREGHRCKSAACPVCARRYRGWLAGTAAQFITLDSAEWTAVSLVHPNVEYPVGRLRQFNPVHYKDRVRKQLDRCGLDVAHIGGIDFAVQTFGAGIQTELWRPHGYLLMRASVSMVQEALEHQFKSTRNTRRPVRMRPVNKDEILSAASYAYKSDFDQKIPCKDRKGNSDNEAWDLDPLHWVEIAPLLHRWGYSSRLMLRRIRRVAGFFNFYKR